MSRYHSIRAQILPGVEYHQNRYARLLDRTVRPDSIWLDLGAGRRMHWGWKDGSPEELVSRSALLVGCDLLAEQLARNSHIEAGFTAAAQELPLPDDCLNLVTANMLLEHLENPSAVFAEVHRVVRRGGGFIFVTPNRAHPIIWLSQRLLSHTARTRLAGLIETRESDDVFRTWYRANTAPRIRELAMENGFEIRVLESFFSFPVLHRPWLATVAEACWIRLMDRQPFKRFGSNLLGYLVKSTSAQADGAD